MNEVEVCYLNEKGVFQSRKTQLYDIYDKAVDVFVRTVKKFQASKTNAIVTLRKRQGNQWTFIKAERI